MNTLYAVVAHHSREKQALELCCALGAELFMDGGNGGALANHRRAIQWAAKQRERVVILEDDAQPVIGFKFKVDEWLECYPHNLISFYLGTGRPPQFQPLINESISLADISGSSVIYLPQLLHGVCYSIPQSWITHIAAQLPERGVAADYAIGDAWRRVTGGVGVVYPIRSLVDHEDGQSVERHPDGQPRTERRKAWRLDN
jgi:hypothetical protein